MRREWYAVVSFASVMVLQGLCLGGEPVPSIADIEKVWKARQAKIDSAVFELETERTIFKGSSSRFINLDRRKRGLAPMPESPPRDHLVKGRRRVSFSGVRTHDSYDEESWDPSGNRLYSKHCAEVFNGNLFKSLDNPSSARQHYPSGLVKKASQAGGALKFPQLPIFMTLRGSHPQYFNSLRQFRVTGKTVPVAERSCLELVRKSSDQQEEVLYLDPARDYVVAKMVILDERQPTWQWSATYRADPVVGWIPHSWEYLLLESVP